MTPTDVLVDVIHQMRQADPDGCLHEDGYGGTGWVQCERDTYSLLDALDALGFTVARKQDAADGQALRELDAAHGGTWSLHVVKQMSGTVGFAIEAWHRQTKVFGKPDDEMPDVYPTIAAAADACREAIEASR